MSLLHQVHVSLDIDACGEILMSLGACVFDRRTGEATSEFYCVPSIKDQLERGLKPDADALLWWLRQNDEARQAVANQEPAEAALSRWRAWQPAEAWVWAYPTSFDLPVIERVCRAFGIRPAWKWTQTMDARTLWRLACIVDPALERIEKEANPTPHHALADAKEQARWIAKYLTPIVREP